VFLKGNTNEDVCDYRIELDLSDSSCVIYAGQSSFQVVAKVRRTLSLSLSLSLIYLFFLVQLVGHECTYHVNND
jgi:hypothetical protein